MTCVLPLLALLAARPAPPPVRAPPSPPAPTVHRWADGLELAVQPVPGARTASLRMVVRTGGADDPAGQAGLAHVLEHLLLLGPDGRALARRARAEGAVLNAHTSTSWTMFELDAPADRFPALAERLLRLVTSPRWEQADLRREKLVIESEEAFDGDAAEASLVDRALFPAPAQAGPLIGTGRTRVDLALDDAVRAFRERHVPPLTTIVVTGAIAPAEAIALVDRAYLVPPVPAPPPSPADPLNLPVEQRVPSFVTATAEGFLLDPADRAVCRELAAVLELRLVLAVREAGPRVPEVFASCARLRGRDLLIGVAYTTTLDAAELPGDMDAVFQGLRRSPPGRDERLRVDRRLARQRERTLADPAELAQALALHAADFGARDLERALPGALPPPARLREVVERTLVPERRFQLVFAPMD